MFNVTCNQILLKINIYNTEKEKYFATKMKTRTNFDEII